MLTHLNADLKDKVFLVTGGAQGLGFAICEALLEAQAKVIIADIQDEKGRKAVASLQESAGEVIFRRLDLREVDEVTKLFQEVRQMYGRLDGVINNAGIDFTKPIDKLSVAEWDAAMAVNLRGPFIIAKCALELMMPRRSGYIVNIVSTAALRAWPEASVYHATKWGLRGFTHALFTEARNYNIKVTALIAGGMRTPFLLDRFPDINQELLQDPKSVAGEVVHLLSMQGDTVIPELMVIPLKETSWP